MQPLPDDISPNDVSQWIGRGYYLVSKDGEEPILCRYLDVRFKGDFDDWRDGSVQVISEPVLDTGPDVVRAKPCEVFIHWPLFGSVNIPPTGRFKGAAYYVLRSPRQHYTRTYAPRLVTVSPVARWELQRAGVTPQWIRSEHSSLLKALFFPSYPEYADARNRLDSGEYYSVALSRHVTVLSDELGGLVCYGPKVAGRLVNGDFVADKDTPEAARCERLLEKVL